MSAVKTVHHADVIGSMLRPHYLAEARSALDAAGDGDRSAAQAALREAEDRAVDEALAIQEGVALEVVTDGEMRRRTFFDFFFSGMTGMKPLPGRSMTFRRPDGGTIEIPVPFTMTDRVGASSCPGVEEFAYASAKTDREIKVTLPSPGLMWPFWNDQSRDAYPDVFDLMADVRDVVADWMRELADAGCTNMQLDAPELATAFADEAFREGHLRARGIDPDRFLDVGTEVVGSLGALELPGVTKTMHVCKGNEPEAFLGFGSYDAFAEKVFKEADGFDIYHLEYDDEHSGDFSPLKKLPDDKVAVIGLVSTRWAALEDKDELKRRIDEAARFHPKEQLGIATQCGFASAAQTAEDRLFTYETQTEKLQLVVDVAREVWN
jgi:5-methyltetrahydropteroyltriglutamate--homocysteine methyltransferase